MIIANFTEGSDYASASGLDQWDYGQRLQIQGLRLPKAVEIDFSLQETGGESESRIGVTTGDVTEVTIPDEVLKNEGAEEDYTIYVFIYIRTKDSGKTVKRIRISTKARPKPGIPDTPEEGNLFEEAIVAVNAAAERAEIAEQGAEDAAEQAQEIASGISADVSGMVAEANVAKNTAVEHANIAVNNAEETEEDKQSAEGAAAAAEESKQAAADSVKQSELIMQQQIAMLGKVPMIYAVMTFEELQEVPNAKEGDFGIVQEPNMMLLRYATHNAAGDEIAPSWVWMTDLNIHFNRESLLGILNLAGIATSGSYADLKNIPNRYQKPIVLGGLNAAVEWDYSLSDTAVVTLDTDKPLFISNAYNGAVAVIQCYGGLLEFPEAEYNKSVTLDYLEPLEAEHITYTLIRNAGKWDVTALVYAGGAYE